MGKRKVRMRGCISALGGVCTSAEEEVQECTNTRVRLKGECPVHSQEWGGWFDSGEGKGGRGEKRMGISVFKFQMGVVGILELYPNFPAVCLAVCVV